MRISLNGEPREVDQGATVAALVELLDVPDGARGVAVAVDGEVVSRGDWPARVVVDGARVEVLRAIGGG